MSGGEPSTRNVKTLSVLCLLPSISAYFTVLILILSRRGRFARFAKMFQRNLFAGIEFSADSNGSMQTLRRFRDAMLVLTNVVTVTW